jgi:glutamate--cysteine ligase
MFYRREGRWTPAEGRSFRSWMNDGIDGSFPSAVDWSLHQTSVFPEVRVKRTIEVRGADCVSAELALGFCAWFVGLLYDEEALSAALALVDRLEQAGSTAERFDLACRDGLGAQLPGLSMAELAREVGAIARSGLSRVEPEALPMLEPLLDRVEAGRSPALDLLEAWSRDPRPEAVIEALRY